MSLASGRIVSGTGSGAPPSAGLQLSLVSPSGLTPPSMGAMTDQAADHTHPDGKDGSVPAALVSASLLARARVGRAPPAHSLSNSAEIGRQPAGQASRATDRPGPDRRQSTLRRSFARSPARCPECPRHIGSQLGQRGLEGPCAGHEYGFHAPRPIRTQRPIRLAQPPSRPIAANSAPDLPAHREARSTGTRTRDPEEHKGTPLLSSASLEYRLDLVGLPEAGATGEPECSDSSTHGAVARR